MDMNIILEIIFMLLVAILLVGAVVMVFQLQNTPPVVITPVFFRYKKKKGIVWNFIIFAVLILLVLFISFVLFTGFKSDVIKIAGNIGGRISELLPLT